MILSTIFRCVNCFSTLRRVGKYAVPELPAYKVNPAAFKKPTTADEELDIDQYYNLLNSQRSHKEVPECRYFAVEYRNRIYHIFNAFCYPMGRMINTIATVIRGKHTPHYRNSLLKVKNGDICVIVNAMDPLFTGKKLMHKNFKYHTGFVGHLKTFSYRSVLNKKPELLYYYLLRKSMPKNKLSEKYMANVKIYRGPKHDIPNIPQFAPKKFITESLTEIDLKKYLESLPSDKKTLVFEADPQNPNVLGKDLHPNAGDPNSNLETDDILETEAKMKTVSQYSNKKILTLQRRQHRIIKRYKTVRAPYPTKTKRDPGYKLFTSEKEARGSPYYEQLANEDLPEIEEQFIEDPLKRKGFDKE